MAFSTSLVNAANLDAQDFFTTTLAQVVAGASDTNIYLNTLPTPSEGFLTIDPTNASTREIIYYTSKGANFVTCPSAANGRGVGGTTAQTHGVNIEVRGTNVAEMWRVLRDGYGIGAGAITQAKLAAAGIDLGVIAAGTAWSTWTPSCSGSGSMNLSSVVVNYAKYRQVGKVVDFSVSIGFTTTGTPNTDILFGAPVQLKSTSGGQICFPAYIGDSGNALVGFGFNDSDALNLHVRRYDTSNWGIGTARSIQCSGTYEAA